MHSDPTVSIIISAYNRPHVIPFAIKSVLASDFEDWETIVVGDGCNADTEAAVRAFTDPRIRFHNLPANTGHQSAPHNKGVELARGEFVLFLNQDDMYFPDHITKRIAFMRASGADISWSPVLVLQRSGLESGPADPEMDRFTLDGAVANGSFNPHSFIISSCWAVRREICHGVGPWLPVSETRLSPSQEWLYRAHQQGRHMAYDTYISVLCIHSGVRRYSYIRAASPEHERAWNWLAAGDREKLNLLNCVAAHDAAKMVNLRAALARRTRPLRAVAERALGMLGIHPVSLQRYLDGISKGGWVGDHTQFTTKPPELALDVRVSFGTGAGEEFLGRGWHPGEKRGCWTAEGTAELFFTTPTPDNTESRLQLQICGHPLRLGDEVIFTLSDGTAVNKTVETINETTVIPLPGPGAVHLSITIKDPTSPLELKRSNDRRVLGYWLTGLRIECLPASEETENSAKVS